MLGKSEVVLNQSTSSKKLFFSVVFWHVANVSSGILWIALDMTIEFKGTPGTLVIPSLF